MIYVWLVAIVVFLVIEAATVGLVSIWFAGGALLSMIAAMLGFEMWIQLAVFVVVSAVFLFASKPLIKKFATSKNQPTNADALVGQTAIVTENIDNDKAEGQVKINGQYWSAHSFDGTQAVKGDKVTVKDIKGVKLIVTK